jgi:hypothetical protein
LEAQAEQLLETVTQILPAERTLLAGHLRPVESCVLEELK